MEDLGLMFAVSILGKWNERPIQHTQGYRFNEHDSEWASMLGKSVKETCISLLKSLATESISENSERFIDMGDITFTLMVNDNCIPFQEEVVRRSLADLVQYFKQFFSSKKEMTVGVLMVVE